LPKRECGTGNHVSRNSVFVDTGAWIALFSARDQYHKEADRSFRDLVSSKKQLVTTNLILAEIHRLLLHRVGSSAASAALSKIDASSLVHIEFTGETHHQSAKHWIERLQDHPISYTDAVSFAVMEDLGCTEALSYDRHFRLAGFTD